MRRILGIRGIELIGKVFILGVEVPTCKHKISTTQYSNSVSSKMERTKSLMIIMGSTSAKTEWSKR